MSRPVPCQHVPVRSKVRTLATTYRRHHYGEGVEEYDRVEAGAPGRVIGKTWRFQGAIQVLHVRLDDGTVLLLGCSAVEIVQKGDGEI